MDKKHVRLIDDNIEELLEVTNKLEDIYAKLEDRHVFNKHMVKHLNVSICYAYASVLDYILIHLLRKCL